LRVNLLNLILEYEITSMDEEEMLIFFMYSQNYLND